MTRQPGSMTRGAAAAVLLALAAVSAFAQDALVWRSASEVRPGARGTIVGTVTAVDPEGFGLAADGDAAVLLRVNADPATRYTGLGVDATESLAGASGLAQLRAGDRVEVTGTGEAGPSIRASAVRLVGRAVAGQAPGEAGAVVEGTIRTIRLLDQSFVLDGDEGEQWTIVGGGNTPVVFEGQTYSIRNLEVGDRVRVEIDARLSSGELRAGRIEVLEDATPDEVSGVRSQNLLTGRVSRLELRANRFFLRADRAGEIRVDAARAVDRAGQPFRLADLQIGDRLRVRGEYTGPNTFRAERIELGSAADADEAGAFEDRGEEPFEGFSTVVFYGTVEENPPNEDHLTIRNRDNDRRLEIVVDEEFIVQRNGSYVRAGQLRRGDAVVIKAFRDPGGNYVAQTIRFQ
ncbi:MAG TPA: DUF5666 domain-containing protein [Thermoanaerobaculia bacterium]|nr:DUF5666 domain-containing protein [Thermoanaerobaculia bacterium]